MFGKAGCREHSCNYRESDLEINKTSKHARNSLARFEKYCVRLCGLGAQDKLLVGALPNIEFAALRMGISLNYRMLWSANVGVFHLRFYSSTFDFAWVNSPPPLLTMKLGLVK